MTPMNTKRYHFEYKEDDVGGYDDTIRALMLSADGDRIRFRELVGLEALKNRPLLSYIIDRGTASLWAEQMTRDRRRALSGANTETVSASIDATTLQRAEEIQRRTAAIDRKQAKFRELGRERNRVIVQVSVKWTWYSYRLSTGVMLGDATLDEILEDVDRRRKEIDGKTKPYRWLTSIVAAWKRSGKSRTAMLRDVVPETTLSSLAKQYELAEEEAA